MEKVALITGASKGIGKELANVFARKGYSLILIARNIKELEMLQSNLSDKYHVNVKILSVDLANPNSVEMIASTFREELPKLDVLVNNAGVGLIKRFTDLPAHELNDMLEVNVTALTRLTYRVLPHMVAKKNGRILNVASTAAYMPGPYMAVYYASKAYVLSFSESIYEEYKKFGITVSALCPGMTQTPFLERAGMQDTPMWNGMPKMSAVKVAETAFKGLMRKKRVIVPGAMNKLMVFLSWISPRFMTAKVTAGLQKPKSS